ncbi:hypothetical protein LJB89_03635 [Tyzzerella sp. OttesenSCG-928-J15]|nr:hypothetical protein [Tyzzerella sp. OttesenSCG-928-J15]
MAQIKRDKDKQIDLVLMQQALLLINLSYKSRQNGPLSIENDVNDTCDEFLIMGYKLMIGGYSPDVVKTIITNLMSLVNDPSELKRLDMIFNFLIVFATVPVYMINLIVFSYFGWNYKDEYCNILEQELDQAIYDSIFINGDFII